MKNSKLDKVSKSKSRQTRLSLRCLQNLLKLSIRWIRFRLCDHEFIYLLTIVYNVWNVTANFRIFSFLKVSKFWQLIRNRCFSLFSSCGSRTHIRNHLARWAHQFQSGSTIPVPPDNEWRCSFYGFSVGAVNSWKINDYSVSSARCLTKFSLN